MSTSSAKSRRNRKKKERKKRQNVKNREAKINRLSPDENIVSHIMSFLDITSKRNIIHASEYDMVFYENEFPLNTSKQFKICLPMKRYYQLVLKYLDSFGSRYLLIKGEPPLLLCSYFVSEIDDINNRTISYPFVRQENKIIYVNNLFYELESYFSYQLE